MPQFGDEHMQAAGVEEAVVSPEVEQYVLGVDHLVAVLAKAFQYFGLAVSRVRSVDQLGLIHGISLSLLSKYLPFVLIVCVAEM